MHDRTAKLFSHAEQRRYVQAAFEQGKKTIEQIVASVVSNSDLQKSHI